MSISLTQIKKHCPEIKWYNFDETKINNIHFDSRKIGRGDLYVSTYARHNGKCTDIAGEKSYIDHAISQGASVLIGENPYSYNKQHIFGQTHNVRKSLAKLADLFYSHPSKKLTMIGITGTNGKTTTSFIVDSILRHSGLKTGLLGTVMYRYGEKECPAPLTTPDPIMLHKSLADMVEMGITHVVMEVSSHALSQYRVEAMDFDVAVLTNITREHLDYHGSWNNYVSAKRKLFNGLKAQAKAILPTSIKEVNLFTNGCQAQKHYYSIASPAPVRAENISHFGTISQFTLRTPQGVTPICCHLPGEYNVENCLAAVFSSLSLGISLENIKKGIESLSFVPGRMQVIDAQQPFAVIIDYAHTPDALEKLLRTLRKVTLGKLLLVFGCGGDRDQGKRPLMGEIASNWADNCWITNDNPRSEDPMTIAKSIQSGFKQSKNVAICLDRYKAIYHALNTAKEQDTVVIAGKGHETTQKIGTKTIHFDDSKITNEILCELFQKVLV